MMDADKAREIATDVQNKGNTEQIKKIEIAIHTAANAGNRVTHIDFYPSSGVKEYLTAKGYKIGVGTSLRNETLVKISW